ncbi:4-hydroxythreonine-4-phosphate dehydrogenase [Catalinimonas alkaloidigena]|uniref:4-hydroxythreonine-4-phosphate dehydrogenase n=1 Tax=Catalinimonas alkaloidigena TaxID=1075417 RepID=A0A1G8WFS1_9BACT|nr:4-hydroxythreonine-4-phosphate dehydrogenase PdxA [Catalinimonas alkaloidigena]SDJ77013.1 4-hydroxythreonine-4-phosphate dehydrogenase [Catalinimonas alkaloidigena]
MEEKHKATVPTIGITLGDFNGIGPEVILKSFTYDRLLQVCTPVIYGSGRILAFYRKMLGDDCPSFYQLKPDQPPQARKINVINCWEEDYNVTPGQVTPEAGQCAWLSLQHATKDLQAGHIQAVVTAPINKHNMQSESFSFPGHTEYFASVCGVAESLMLMVSDELRVGTVTGHVSLGQVAKLITPERVRTKLRLLYDSLRKDFGITKPRIAVLGLNPHAGENGLLGHEEKDILQPIIEEERTKGRLVYGPYPADGFFGTGQFNKFDAVLAMYHDQGLVPFKTIAFANGVNYTAGLSLVRTSPDHGTAYDLAGKGQADATSMQEALLLAHRIATVRQANA